MTPHIEIFILDDSSLVNGEWAKVLGTEHKHDDTKSIEAKFAHTLLTSSAYKQIHEVSDKLGPECDEEKKPTG
jgi:hypothetical protein